MAKAKKPAGDASVDFLDSLTELHKLSARTDISKLQTGSITSAKGLQICAVYAKARPFLEIIIKIPFIPSKAKEVIQLLMTALNTLCPR